VIFLWFCPGLHATAAALKHKREHTPDPQVRGPLSLWTEVCHSFVCVTVYCVLLQVIDRSGFEEDFHLLISPFEGRRSILRALVQYAARVYTAKYNVR